MANCNTSCYVDSCITAPPDCRVAAPGGWQRLWYANRCDVQRFHYESINGEPRARVKDITLKSGAQLYSVHFYRKTGLKFEAQAVDENGWRWDHELILPLAQRDGNTMATLMRMVGGEFVFIGLHRDGRYYVAGLGQEGFRLENWNDAKGRTASDGAIQELTFRLSDGWPQTELLYDDGSASSVEERTDATQTWLDGLVACGGGDSGGGDNGATSDILLTSNPQVASFEQGQGASAEIVLELHRTNCSEEASLSLENSTLPAGVSFSLPASIPSGTSQASFELQYDGSAPVGTHYFTVMASTGACGSNLATITVDIL
jgi:hypothetical protein